MNKISFLGGWLVLSLIFSSCQSPSPTGERSPASPQETFQTKLKNLYVLKNKEIELLIQQKHLQKKGSTKSQSYLQNQTTLNELKSQIQNLESTTDFSSVQSVPTSISSQWSDLGNYFEKTKKEIFTLYNVQFYKNADQPRNYELSYSGDETIKLRLNNRLWTWENPFLPETKKATPAHHGPRATVHTPQKYLKAQWSCYGPEASEHLKKFDWYDQGQNGQVVSFKLKKEELPCLLKFKEDANVSEWHAVKFVAVAEKSLIKELENQTETCFLPDQKFENSLDNVFLTSNYNSMTCPQKMKNLTSLAPARMAFQEKVKSLLGQYLPESFIDNKDAFAEIDFSKAPQLDFIAASYLVFRGDFHGNVLKRLMEYHAKKGALVRILTSDVITLAKDRQMLMDFAATYPNVKISFYEYNSRLGLNLKDMLNELHRTNHIKLLVTYSKSNEANNRVILGGRNVHDGFLFETNPGHTDPRLVFYDKDEAFTFWEDYDVLIQDQSFTKNILSQFMSLWNYDQKSFFTRSTTQNILSAKPVKSEVVDPMAKETIIRHFLSFPFVDNMSLEKLFVEMIDNAKEEIFITSPYFSPTPEISKAFERAVDRGVQITVITRLNLDRDTADIILSDINKKSVNKFLGKVKMFEFTTAGKILHRKLFVVDRNYAIVGSVNLNQRSFFHDFENALMVRSNEYNTQIRHLIDLALQESKEITEKQKVVFWKKVLIGIFKREF